MIVTIKPKAGYNPHDGIENHTGCVDPEQGPAHAFGLLKFSDANGNPERYNTDKTQGNTDACKSKHRPEAPIIHSILHNASR